MKGEGFLETKCTDTLKFLKQTIFVQSNTTQVYLINYIALTCMLHISACTRVGTLIVATIYLQLIQNRYMFPSFTVLQCSHQHCVQPAASDVEVVGYL